MLLESAITLLCAPCVGESVRVRVMREEELPLFFRNLHLG